MKKIKFKQKQPHVNNQTLAKNVSFSKDTLQFLIKASKQKKSDWLEKNNSDYERLLKAPFIQLAENIKKEIKPLAPDYHFPSKGLARIKRPDFKVAAGLDLYKDWVSLIASRPSLSRFESNPHLFFGIFPNETDQIIIAGGLWQPTSKQTRLIREAIYKNSEPFHELFSDQSFKTCFKSGFYENEKSIRVPRGFNADHSDIEWLKLKKFVVYKKITLKEFSSTQFPKQVVKYLKQALRLNQLLELALKMQWPSS